MGSNPTRSATLKNALIKQEEENLITEQKKQTIKLVIAIVVLVLILSLVGIAMIIYEVEGETNMPFQLSKIVVIGTAEGVENNDVYFYIDENKEKNKEEDLLIKNVKISNIQITKEPQKGTIKAYMPNSEAGRLYSYDEQFIVEDKLEYKGASQSSSTDLEIGSKGGTLLIRFSNTDIANYTSDKDEEIVHDGTWLTKLELEKEEVQFTVTFDLTIETTKNKYQAEITLEMPTGNLQEEGNCYLEKTDMDDIVFKRVK